MYVHCLRKNEIVYNYKLPICQNSCLKVHAANQMDMWYPTTTTTTTTKPFVSSIWGRLHEPKENMRYPTL